LQSSKKFTQILQIILKLGSVLNRSNASGNSQGFRLESLGKVRSNCPPFNFYQLIPSLFFAIKLGDTKSKDGKTTVLDYLAQIVRTKMPQVVDFYNSELADLPAASKCSQLGFFRQNNLLNSHFIMPLVALDVVIDNMKEMKKTLQSLEKELVKHEPTGNSKVPSSKQTSAASFASKLLVPFNASSNENKENASNHNPSSNSSGDLIRSKVSTSAQDLSTTQSKPLLHLEGDRFAAVMKVRPHF